MGRVEARVRVKVLRFIYLVTLYHSGLLQHCGAGVATPDPGEAPPMAGFFVGRGLL